MRKLLTILTWTLSTLTILLIIIGVILLLAGLFMPIHDLSMGDLTLNKFIHESGSNLIEVHSKIQDAEENMKFFINITFYGFWLTILGLLTAITSLILSIIKTIFFKKKRA